MATYILKRKNFGLFSAAGKNFRLSGQHFKNIAPSYKNNGFWKGGVKEATKGVAHSGAGLLKGTVGVGLTTAGIGAAGLTAGAIAFDNIGNK